MEEPTNDPVRAPEAEADRQQSGSAAPSPGMGMPSGGSLVAAPGAKPPVRAPALVPRPRRRHRTVLLLAALLLLVGGGVWYFEAVPLTVQVVRPMHGKAIEAVYATGIVEAIDTARAGTTVAGRVIAVPVQEGDVVKQGQLLAQLDDAQARQRVEDARARLALADQELARDRALAASGTQTQQQLQRSVAERDRAQAGVVMALRQWEDFRVLSPLDGIVMKREVDPGNTAGANTALFTVASTRHLRVAADVDERDIAQVRMDAKVAIRADAYPGEAFPAKVTNIRRQGDTATRTFRVEANLPEDTRLLIGMTVDVNIVTAERDNAMLLPVAAVRHGLPQGGEPGAGYVFAVRDGMARRVPVELGAVGTETAEVRSGLNDQADIITGEMRGLKDGTRVRIAPP